MELSSTTRVLSGVILITVPTIEYGGTFLLGMLRSGAAGYLDNPIRQNLFRAGHAHAGVLVNVFEQEHKTDLELVTSSKADSLTRL